MPKKWGMQDGPPHEAQDAVDIAAGVAGRLAAGGRELHFMTHEASGYVVVQERSLLDGMVLRTLTGGEALDILSG